MTARRPDEGDAAKNGSTSDRPWITRYQAIRPDDLTFNARKRVRRKIELFHRAFIELGGVSRQFRAIMPPRELGVVGTYTDIRAIAQDLGLLAGEIAREAARCEELAAEVRTQLEDDRLLPAPGRIEPIAIPRPRPIPPDLFASHAPQPRRRGKS